MRSKKVRSTNTSQLAYQHKAYSDLHKRSTNHTCQPAYTHQAPMAINKLSTDH
ncbi:hypothetical protein DPMN_172601 [Dreissena polymorpha]|uniref:Uncharacterized protein n=1 Tax=Dreissena polymorpha TaxID=45954 RepID=A0A9D4E3Z0_DREPO|nr:hypothetical protein DPMN_172601 [Dreissena polymorpha]